MALRGQQSILFGWFPSAYARCQNDCDDISYTMLRHLSNFVGSTILRHNKATSSLSRMVGQLTPGSTRISAVRQLSSTAATTTSAGTTLIDTHVGRAFAVVDTRKHPKLKPSIVRKRLDKMRTYVGAEKNIRHSPWRLNLICQMVAGLPLIEALLQLEYCEKTRAPLVAKVLKRTAHTAAQKDGLQRSQLEVAECFVTKGTPLKRIKPMGRGRYVDTGV
jgi:hypothetical protein